ncbi:DUF4030 domain-containing protein [Robertmurraya sp. Marseille-Q9965]
MKKQVEDINFDHSLKKFDSGLVWKTKQKQELKNRIMTDMERLCPNEKPKNVFLRTRKRGLAHKLIYSGIALLILFGLFIGSAFISPAMAEVASKIPYLNKIFHSEPINQTLLRELETKGYKISGLGGNAGHISIFIDGTEAYFQNVHDEIEEIATDILKEKDYDGYKIEVSRQIDRPVPPPTEFELALEEALKESYDKLIELQFKIGSYGYQYSSPTSDEVVVELEIPSTEKRIEEIQKIISESLKIKKIDSYSLKINKVDFSQREKEAKWDEIFPVIFEGLSAKKDYKVIGFAYSFHPAPLQIIIKTSINASDKDADEKVRLIEKTINEFLNSEEIQKKINGDPFEIIIRGKNKQRIN